MIYQPSCQGVTFVSPSPPVGGTPCRIQTSVNLGVLIKSKSYMFGDNRSVVTSATLPHSTLSKRHNIIAFNRVREAIAAKIIDFHWIQSEYNLSDMVSKHWEHNKIFPMIQKLLITCGPITLIPRSATEEISKLPE